MASRGVDAATARTAALDGVGLLTCFVFLLIAIPSRLIFAPLGAAGTPAQVLGLGMAAWWASMWLTGATPRMQQPPRIAMLVFVGAVLASYVVATTRPIDGMEQRSADRGLLSCCAWFGIMLVATDAIPTRARLDHLLRRLVFAGGCLASLGLLQFVTDRPFTNYIVIPGLASNSELTSITGRAGFARPAGTALHPIEFGAVLTTILPIALHYAMVDRDRPLLRRWYPVLAIAVAVPISISRSAILSTIVVLAFLLPTWPVKARRRAYAALIVLFGALYVLVPGLLGTLRGLFTGISGDSSAQSRSGSYALAWEFIQRAPIFGRGFLTFLPSYRILDNQYLGTLIDTGVVGLTALLGIFVVGVITSRNTRRWSVDPRDRSLAQALAAAIAASGASFALYDAFSFPMAASLIFLVLGCVSALRRVATTESNLLGSALDIEDHHSRSLRRRIHDRLRRPDPHSKV